MLNARYIGRINLRLQPGTRRHPIDRVVAPEDEPIESATGAVLDMGASAIRLVVAEIAADGVASASSRRRRAPSCWAATRSASSAIRSRTVDAALAALEGFRRVIDGYGVQQVRAVATSAVREARNGDMFLDRIRGRTGIAFDIINEAEESRLVFLAVAALGDHRGVRWRMDAAGRGRRRQHQPDAAAPGTAEPVRRLRARRDPAAPAARAPAASPTICSSRC